MYIYIYIVLYVNIYIIKWLYICINIIRRYVCRYTHKHTHIYIYTYLCMYIYIYIYTHTHACMRDSQPVRQHLWAWNLRVIHLTFRDTDKCPRMKARTKPPEVKGQFHAWDMLVPPNHLPGSLANPAVTESQCFTCANSGLIPERHAIQTFILIHP